MADIQQNYKNRAEAYRFVKSQGISVSERKFYNDASELGIVAADKSIQLSDLVAYINRERTESSKNGTNEDHRARLLKEQADKMEFENELKRGKYLLREEEEQRDAAILAGLRRHIEASAPDRLQAIIAELGKLVDDDLRSKLVARQPEWLQQDLDFLDKMFDEFRGV